MTMEDTHSNDRGIVTITSEAMEDEMVCGMEVEIAATNASGGTKGLPLSRSTSWSLSSIDYNPRHGIHGGFHKQLYTGPFLPDSCEVDDVADGRCSPLYNLKRKASRSKQVMHLQMTNPTLSINSMTDMSDCQSCPSDEVSPVNYVESLEETLDDFEATTVFAEAGTLADVISSSSDETGSTETSDSASASVSSSSIESRSTADYTATDDISQSAQNVVAGPERPPLQELMRPIINVLEPSPDSVFLDIIERSFPNLRHVALSRSNLPLSFATPRDLSIIVFHQPLSARLTAMRDCGEKGFLLAPIKHAAISSLAPLVIHADNTGNEITMCDLGSDNPCYSILRSLQLVGEATKLKSQTNGWASGLICCDMEANHGAPVEHASDSMPVQQGDIVADDDATTVLFEDEELRAIMAETKGGNDLSKLLPCFSEDTAATLETDDGLRLELKALDGIENDLRRELQDFDLFVNGVYIQDVKMKSESSESLIQADLNDMKAAPGTPKPSRPRRVRFSKKNTEFVFGRHADDDIDKEEGIGEMLLTTCEDLYYVLEEMTEEIGFACLKTYKRTKKKCRSGPSRTGSRPVKRSTVYFCA